MIGFSIKKRVGWLAAFVALSGCATGVDTGTSGLDFSESQEEVFGVDFDREVASAPAFDVTLPSNVARDEAADIQNGYATPRHAVERAERLRDRAIEGALFALPTNGTAVGTVYEIEGAEKFGYDEVGPADYLNYITLDGEQIELRIVDMAGDTEDLETAAEYLAGDHDFRVQTVSETGEIWNLMSMREDSVESFRMSGSFERGDETTYAALRVDTQRSTTDSQAYQDSNVFGYIDTTETHIWVNEQWIVRRNLEDGLTTVDRLFNNRFTVPGASYEFQSAKIGGLYQNGRPAYLDNWVGRGTLKKNGSTVGHVGMIRNDSGSEQRVYLNMLAGERSLLESWRLRPEMRNDISFGAEVAIPSLED